MKSKTKVLRRGAVLALVIGILLSNVVAYNHAYAMLHFVDGGTRTSDIERLSVWDKVTVLFAGVCIPRPRMKEQAKANTKDFETVAFSAADGVQLAGWYAAGPPQAPLVLLFHGYAAEKSSVLLQARAFQKLGYGVLLVDFRGSGDSSGNYTTIGYEEGKDVAAAVAYAKQRKPEAKLALYGISMGSAAVLRAIYAEGVQPDAVILESVFDTMLNTTKNRFETMGVPSFPAAEMLVTWGGEQFGFNGFQHNPQAYAARLQCPVLFLHGTQDPRARPADARRVFDAVQGPKEYEEFIGGHHENYAKSFPEQWEKAVGGFLSKTLATTRNESVATVP